MDFIQSQSQTRFVQTAEHDKHGHDRFQSLIRPRRRKSLRSFRMSLRRTFQANLPLCGNFRNLKGKSESSTCAVAMLLICWSTTCH